MGVVQSQRTLVKSIPELWAELSESATLGRMLHEPFGEIRITRLEPESSIQWESELAAGAVELEPSGFGTHVRLTAEIAPPPPAPEPSAPPRRGLLARLFRRSAPPPPPEPLAPVTVDASSAQSALVAILDEIGAARHRPFSPRASG